MRCPYCASEATQVKDSRPAEDNTAIRRRRVCPDCSARFTTHERVQLRELTVVKRSGRKVPFDRDKLLGSVVIALRKRPVDRDDIERMVSEIVRELETRGDQEITSEDIGEAVMDALRGLDPVGYVRFASVYRDFREAADFEGVLGEIARDAVPPPAEPWLEDERARLAAAKAKRGQLATVAPISNPRSMAQPLSQRPVAAKKH
ncbi:MAG: transcriptional regulator NrdR [Pseudomonadota bacterium]